MTKEEFAKFDRMRKSHNNDQVEYQTQIGWSREDIDFLIKMIEQSEARNFQLNDDMNMVYVEFEEE